MQAHASLSQEQKICLEAVALFLKSATVYLQAVEPMVLPEDTPQLKGLLLLGEFCMGRLPAHFPELTKCQRGGVV